MKVQTEVRTLKKGKYVLIDDEPCIITDASHSKPGKHGSAKARLDTVGIFDGKKRSIIQPVSAKIYVPLVERKQAQVISIQGNTIQLMDMEDYSTFELPATAEELPQIKEGEEITYIQSMGRQKFTFR
jgi:translation initiation factor 5A